MRKIKTKCHQCKKTYIIEKLIPILHNNKTVRYCNRCLKKKNKNQNDIIIQNKRKNLLIKYHNTCQQCHRTINKLQYLHIHHKNKNRYDNNDDNLLLLCIICHQQQHKDNPWVYKMMSKQILELQNS